MRSHRKRIGMAALAGLALSGCTTPAELAAREPELTVVAELSERAMAACIVDAWSNHQDFLGSTLDVRYTPRVEGSRVSAHDPGGWALTHALADITEIEGGVRVDYYARGAFAFGDRFKGMVRECAAAATAAD